MPLLALSEHAWYH